MILDAIIGLFASLFSGLFAISSFVTNAVCSAIEAVVRIFIPEFSLGRDQTDEGSAGGEGEQESCSTHPGAISAALLFVITFCVILGLIFRPLVLERRISLVAEDGHSLPFAALVIHTRNAEEHRRTDNAGNITVPRFGLTGITLKDPRYVEQKWEKPEIPSRLIVRRTVLGSGLDKLADRLLRPAGK